MRGNTASVESLAGPELLSQSVWATTVYVHRQPGPLQSMCAYSLDHNSLVYLDHYSLVCFFLAPLPSFSV